LVAFEPVWEVSYARLLIPTSVADVSAEYRVDKIDSISEQEHAEIERFCEEGGLPRTDWFPGDVLVTFTIRGPDGRLEATAKLERHGERMFIEDLVVRQDLHGRGYGRRIVDAVVEDAKSRKAEAVWAMARAAEFFKERGFVESDDCALRTEILGYCRRCKDYGRKCQPELLRLSLV
jgi:N-acetylglutamate synthase-like GNAT family acetyltransferase